MLLLGDQGPHCYLSSSTFFSVVRIPYVMRTTIHNRRGTNHLIDPRFRSELLESKEEALVEIQALLNRFSKICNHLIRIAQSEYGTSIIILVSC